MEGYITEIESFLEETHKSIPLIEIPVIEEQIFIKEINKEANKEIDLERTTLDMKILKNRMDSVSIIKYYKDLKNNRIKANENISYIDTEKDINDIINKTNHDKPWGKADNYTKKKKIEVFMQKCIEMHKIETIETIKNELNELFENKKISKKNIEFDTNNNIIRLGNYSLI